MTELKTTALALMDAALESEIGIEVKMSGPGVGKCVGQLRFMCYHLRAMIRSQGNVRTPYDCLTFKITFVNEEEATLTLEKRDERNPAQGSKDSNPRSDNGSSGSLERTS